MSHPFSSYILFNIESISLESYLLTKDFPSGENNITLFLESQKTYIYVNTFNLNNIYRSIKNTIETVHKIKTTFYYHRTKVN